MSHVEYTLLSLRSLLINTSISYLTDIGKVREHNEDSLITIGATESPFALDAILIVADGMGGHLAGEVASAMAIEGISSRMAEVTELISQRQSPEMTIHFADIFREVNKEIYTAGQAPENLGMGTTCTMAVIVSDDLIITHIGDSRAYLIRSETLHQVTTDHSWVEEAVEKGLLTKEEARIHPNRNMITKAMGIHMNIDPDSLVCKLYPRDILVLCSDGLNAMISDEDILSTILNPPSGDPCRDLVILANANGGLDNISVIICEMS